MFEQLLNEIIKLSASKEKTFSEASEIIKENADNLNIDELIEIVRDIGTIPERIVIGSSAEKLFSKASDCILAKCFREFGLRASALSERGNSADIVA